MRNHIPNYTLFLAIPISLACLVAFTRSVIILPPLQDSHFQAITKKINDLGGKKWNQQSYRSIGNEIKAKANTGLLTKSEQTQLVKNLDLAYILTLKSAIDVFFTSGRQATELTPLMKSEARRYRNGPYSDNVKDINKAIDDFISLQREEGSIARDPASLTEQKIENHFRALERLERQPFLNRSSLVRQMSNNSKAKLKEDLLKIKSEPIGPAIEHYVTTYAYHADSTQQYTQQLQGVLNHPRLSGYKSAETFCETMQNDLKQHEYWGQGKDGDQRYINKVGKNPNESCESLFGKYTYYVRQCEIIRQDTTKRE